MSYDGRLLDALATVFGRRADPHNRSGLTSRDQVAWRTEFTLCQLRRYLRVREMFDSQYGGRPNFLEVIHSDLLLYLLKGGEPAPLPPPALHGHLCHSLAAGERVKVCVDLSECEFQHGASLTICQNSRSFIWIDASSGLIEHLPTRDRYLLRGDMLQRCPRAAVNPNGAP